MCHPRQLPFLWLNNTLGVTLLPAPQVREPWEEVRIGKDPIHLADEWQTQAANQRTLTGLGLLSELVNSPGLFLVFLWL